MSGPRGPLALLGLTLALASGCGGDDLNEAVLVCDALAFVPCGGDLDGLWHATSACVVDSAPIERSRACGPVEIAYETGVSGALEFSGDQASNSARIRERYRATLSPACTAELLAEAGVARCEALSPPEPLQACVTRGDGCLCSYTQIEGSALDGTVTAVRPGVLELVAEGAPPSTLRYCVDGDYVDIEFTAVDRTGTARRIVTRWAK